MECSLSLSLNYILYESVGKQLLVTLSRCCSCRHFSTHVTACPSLSPFSLQGLCYFLSHILFSGQILFCTTKSCRISSQKKLHKHEWKVMFLYVNERVLCVRWAQCTHNRWNRSDASEITWGATGNLHFVYSKKEKGKIQRIQKMCSRRVLCVSVSLALRVHKDKWIAIWWLEWSMVILLSVGTSLLSILNVCVNCWLGCCYAFRSTIHIVSCNAIVFLLPYIFRIYFLYSFFFSIFFLFLSL